MSNQDHDSKQGSILSNNRVNVKSVNQPALEKVETMVGMVSDIQSSFTNNAKTDQQELLDAIQKLQAMVDELSAHFATRH
jgi:predicted amino acid-binding ACT domain protein